jgi:hypothetical protein
MAYDRNGRLYAIAANDAFSKSQFIYEIDQESYRIVNIYATNSPPRSTFRDRWIQCTREYVGHVNAAESFHSIFAQNWDIGDRDHSQGLGRIDQTN